MAIADEIEALAARRPGLTEAQLAEQLFGGDAYQQRVNSTCRRLVKEGRLERRGRGGHGDPFTYHRTTRAAFLKKRGEGA